ncbi:MAG TPA: hypothetical protein VGO45_09495 [Bacteroidia bacterium]|jgi:hypothetical protein|nr:hypothetical protein [Bacteroidia bacterium]
MKDTKTPGQTMPGKQADRDENTQKPESLQKNGSQKPGFATDDKQGKNSESGKMSSPDKSEKSKIGFSREDEDNDDREQRTGEEQDEENDEIEPARRIKTPVAGSEMPKHTDRKK